jgi:outer membrane protein assembly factor BamB
MTYREAPAPTPLITYLDGRIVALHPETGALLWNQVLEHVPQRVVVAEPSVFVAPRGGSTLVSIFDLHTGEPRGTVDAGFGISTALAQAGNVYFGGSRGLLGLRADGTVLFCATTELMQASAWHGDKNDLVMKDAAGRELWRLLTARFSNADGMLILGDATAQTDFEG